MEFSRQEYWSVLPIPSPYLTHSPLWKGITDVPLITAAVVSCLALCMYAQSLQPRPTFVTLWTPKLPLFMGSSRQEYLTGFPCPPTGDLPDPGIQPGYPASPALQVDSLPTEPVGRPIQFFQFSSVAQLCLTLCNPMNHSMPGLPVHH